MAVPVRTPRLLSRLAKTAGLLAVLVAVVLGGVVVDAALLVPAGAPVELAPGVQLAPLSGWRLASRQEAERPALLTRGSGNLAVLSTRTGGGGAELARWYLRRYLEPASANLVVSPVERIWLATGFAVRVAYRGHFDGQGRGGAVVGEVTALVSRRGTGVVFDAWAVPEVYEFERGDVRAMILRARVR